jgi:hypothetical protein
MALVGSERVGHGKRHKVSKPFVWRGRNGVRVVAAGSLRPAVTDPAPGGCTPEGAAAPDGARRLLDVEVRRNEVLLRARGGADGGWDVAVGLDDFRDALEGVVTA